MRESLKRSLHDSPAEGFERYVAGSIIICNRCTKPIAILEQSIALGDKAGQMAQAFAPLRMADLETLAVREDIDAGVRAWVRSLTPDQRAAHCERLPRFRAGDPMLCPCCGETFVQVLAVERGEVLDKSYVIELVTIPPPGHRVLPIRGTRLGTDGEWLHRDAPGVH